MSETRNGGEAVYPSVEGLQYHETSGSLSGTTMARTTVQGSALMVRVMEAVAQMPGFTAKAIKVVTTSRIIRGISSNSSLVIRATRRN